MRVLRRTLYLSFILFLIGCVGLVSMVAVPSASAQAASPLIVLSQQLFGATQPIPSGKSFKIRLTYECSGSTGTGCSDVVLTTTLPGTVTQIAHTEDSNVQRFSFDAGTGQASWSMKPLALGTTGQFEVTLRFNPGTTLDGTVGTIASVATSSNATPQNPADITVSASASDQTTLNKIVIAPGTADSDTVYRIAVCTASGSGEGALNATGVNVTDLLPAGATFLSASPAPASVSTVGGRTQLAWSPQDIQVPSCAYYFVRVSFPAGTNPIGSSHTNDASVSYTPLGGSLVTSAVATTHTIPGDAPGFRGSKSANLDYAIIGSGIEYVLGAQNTGNANLSNVQLVDAIPNNIDVTAITSGSALNVDYQKNGSATWIPGVPLGSNVAVTSFPGFVSGDYVSGLRFTIASLPVYTTVADIQIAGTVINPPNGGGPAAALPLQISNTLQGEATYKGAAVAMSNTPTANLDTDQPEPRPTLSKTASSSEANPNDTVSYNVSLENRGYPTNSLDEPQLSDLLPVEAEYVAGSWAVVGTQPPGCETPAFTATPNFGGSGRTMLRWDWAGTGCKLYAGDPEAKPRIPGDTIRLSYQTQIKPGIPAGTVLSNHISLTNYTNAPGNVKAIDCINTTDKTIYTTNGSDPARFCSIPSTDVTVLSSAQIESAKWVKGQLDTDFSRDPVVGQTVRGGNLTFAVVLNNTGNIDFNNLQIIDLLPYKDADALPTSNVGTRDQAALGTAWTPYLSGPIDVSPAIPGLTIYYSTEENPCRPLVVDSHPDTTCTPMTIGAASGPGVWSTALPDDPTAIRSAWFQFPVGYTLAHGQQVRFEYTMFAPSDAPLAGPGGDAALGNNDDTNVAWNTFAYRVTRADDSSTLVAQPPRVGIEVTTDTTTASFGNYVWHDINQNGIQDDGPASGLNGVTVRLYTSAGTLVGTRTTSDDSAGNPGYYLFGGLTPGQYYAEFVAPDGYTFTTAGQGGDPTQDSDGVTSVSANVQKTAVVTLAAGDNLDYDQGLITAPVSIGNRVWFDTNNNSLLDAGEVGVQNVAVELFHDSNADGVLTGFERNPIATTTTNSTGYYLFTEQNLLNGMSITPTPLQPGSYIVGISNANFTGSGALVGYWSSGTSFQSAGTTAEATPADPNTDTDSDDNGALVRATTLNATPFYLGGVLSPATLVDANEPTGETAAVGLLNQSPGGTAIADDHSNETVDFGFYTLSMGSLVWNDNGSGSNYNNGVKDADENGIAGVNVRLYAADDTTEIPVGPDGILGTSDDANGGVTTDASGNYRFSGLADSVYSGQPNAGYVVKITAPTGMLSSTDSATTALPSNNLDQDTDENGIGASGGTIATATGSNAFLLEAGDTAATVSISNATGTTTNPTVDFGLVPVYSLGNRVWYDTNNNGVIDGGESGINGVQVDLYAADVSGNPTGARLATQNTSGGGYYLFTDLYRGDYVVVLPSANFGSGKSLRGYTSSTGSTDDTNVDSDDSGRTGTTAGYTTAILSSMISLGPDDTEPTGEPATPSHTDTTVDARSNLTVDFGFYRLTLGNQVWHDVDNNGVYQPNGADGIASTADDEKGISGVQINLYDATSTLIATTTTNASGQYLFDRITIGALAGQGIPAGSYTVVIPASESASGKPLFGFSSSLLGAAAPAPDTNVDSDDNGAPSGGNLVTSTFSLVAGTEAAKPNKVITNSSATTNDPTIDFGVHTMSLGNLVWHDLNNDGIKGAGEPGVDGVAVRLYADSDKDGVADGAALGTDTTSNGGHYLFNGLPDGSSYIVEIVLPAGYTSSNGQKDDLTAPMTYEPGLAETASAGDDGKDHGTRSGTVVRSGTITLAANTEPIGETDTAVSAGKTNAATDSNSQFTIDFGIYAPLSLGNMIWIDANNDGIYQPTEALAPDGVAVSLYWDQNGDNAISGAETTAVRTATTVGGLYLFDTLVPGKYRVALDASNFTTGGLLEGYVSSTGAPGNATGPSEGAATPAPDTNIDGDDNGTTLSGEVRSGLVTLAAGTEPTGENPDNDLITPDTNENLTVDFGVFLPASLGDYVWNDANRDGVQDATETGIDGVTVRLYSGATLLATAITGDDPNTAGTQHGFYHFPNLEANTTYTVKLDNAADFTSGPLFGYVLTSANAAGATNATDSDAILAGGIPTITATTGAAGSDTPTYDAGFYAIATLGDYVWLDTNANGVQDATESGIDGVTVRLYTGSTLIATTTTGDDPNTAGTQHGFYHFANLLPNTTYTVKLDNAADFTSGPLAGYALSIRDQGGNDALDSDADLVSGIPSISAATGAAGSDTRTYDFGFFQFASLGDSVWLDVNVDGVQDATETGIDGVTVRLYTANGADGIAGNADDALPVATTITGDNPATPGTETGFYLFTGLRPNTTYTVKLDNAADSTSGPLADLLLTVQDQPTTTDALDSDAAMVSGIAQITSAATGAVGSSTPTYDFGFFLPASLGDYVWHDTNGNGVQDATETGIDGVTVRLYTANGADGIAGNADDTLPVATATTGDNPATPGTETGFYHFGGLRPNTTYSVRLDNTADYTTGPLAGYRLTAQNNGNGALDSDAALVAGIAQITSAQTGTAGSDTPTYDVGFVAPASLGDYVWDDVNRDGTQDAGESGIDGVTVNLYAADGTTLIATTTTGDNPATPGTESGFYSFAGLLPNTGYVVKFDHAADYGIGGPLYGYTLTPAHVASATDAGDSDATEVAGINQISATTGAENTDTPTYDAGFFGITGLGDYVWFDANSDGLQDAGEAGIDGVTVNLYAADGTTLVATTVTGDNPTTGTLEHGYYHFASLIANTTYVVKLDTASDTAAGGPLAGMILTTTDATAATDATDSDATLASGIPTITVATGAIGSDDPTNDFGFVKSYALGNRVWFDTNNNGILDAGERGVQGVVVELYRDTNTNGFDASDTFVAQTTTTANGYYLFSGLIAGNYALVLPEGNFTSGGALQGYWSSLTSYDTTGTLVETVAPGPDTDTENDDNGTMTGLLGQAGGFVASQSVTLGGSPGDDEPLAEADPTVGITDATPDARSNTTADFGFYTASLGNLVWHDTNNDGMYQPNGADASAGTADDETGIGNVRVELWPADSTGAAVGGAPIQSADTLANGTFGFPGLPQGSYIVRLAESNFGTGGALEVFRSSTGGASLTAGSFEPAPGPNNNTDNDDNGTMSFTGSAITTIESLPIALEPGTTATGSGIDVDTLHGATHNTTVDFGVYQPVSLGNRVFVDLDNSGTLNGSETGIGAVQVQLFRSGSEVPVGPDGVLGTSDDAPGGMLTDSAGYYLFQQLTPGSYVVAITPPAGYSSSTGKPSTNQSQSGPYEPGQSPDNDINDDDNGTQSGSTITSLPVTLTSGGEPITDGDADAQSNLSVDFGIFQPASIGSFVWSDENGDGVYDAAETGLTGITVTLYDAGGTVIATTVTGADGSWFFGNLPGGTYVIGFSNLPVDAVFSPINQGGDPTVDSDADPATGKTAPIVLAPGTNNITIFAGIILPTPTAITLLNFSARYEQGSAVVRWTTTAETNSRGFALYRSTTRDLATAQRVTQALIPAQYPTGGSYTWTDTQATQGTRFFYWLEEVGTDGKTHRYGPAQLVTPAATTQIFLPLLAR